MPLLFVILYIFLNVLFSSTWLRRVASLRQVEVTHRAAGEVWPLAAHPDVGDKVQHRPSGPGHVSCILSGRRCVIGQRPAPWAADNPRPLGDGAHPLRGWETRTALSTQEPTAPPSPHSPHPTFSGPPPSTRDAQRYLFHE